MLRRFTGRIALVGLACATVLSACGGSSSSSGAGNPTSSQIAEARRLLDPQNTGQTTTAQDKCVAEAVVQNPSMDEIANDMANTQNGDLRQAVMTAYLLCAYNFVLNTYMRFAPKSFTAAQKACLRSQFTQLDVGSFAEIIVEDPDAEYVGPLVIHTCTTHSSVDPLKHLKIPASAGQGGSGTTGPSAAIAAKAQAVTAEANSTAFALTWTWTAPQSSQTAPPQKISATGVELFPGKAAKLTFAGPGTVQGGAPLQVVSHEATVDVDGAAAGHKSSALVSAPATLPGALALRPSQITAYLPSELLTLVASLSNLQPVGAGSINGQSTTEYSGTLPASADQAFAGLFGGDSAAASTAPGTADVWFDSKGRLVQFETSVALDKPQSGSSLVVQETLSDFGLSTNVPSAP